MKKYLILMLILMIAPFASFDTASATGWGECGWSINYPIETSTHRAHAYGHFACTSSGTRVLKLELWRDFSLYPDIRIAKAVKKTFYGDSGGFFIDSPVCTNVQSSVTYYGRAWMINPSTNRQSSAHRGESKKLTIICGEV